MKITLELEVGYETGAICGALIAQIDMINEANRLGLKEGNATSDIVLNVSKRLLKTIEDQVEPGYIKNR